MRKKVLGRNVEPRCGYCQYGTRTPDGQTVLCPKKGVLDKDDSCKKFRYDPLKRVPREDPEILSFSERDFSLADAAEKPDRPDRDRGLPRPDDGTGAPPAADEEGFFLSDENFILE